MIKEIVMKNIKGQDTIQPLTGKDIIIGSNGVGKTTRLQALGIALLGYVPGEGKLPAETFKLSTGDKMTVGLKTEDFSFTRTFEKTEKNGKDGSTTTSIKQDIEVSPSKGEKKSMDKEGRISAEMGSFPVMMDFNEFLSLSDAKRREFIYSLSGFDATQWNRDKIQQHLEELLLTPELEINDPDKFLIMKEVITEAMKEYPESFDIQSGLQSMMNWADNKLSFWKKEKQKSEGAVKKIAELKNQLSETDRNIAQNKEELESLQQQLIQVEKQISADTEKKKVINDRFQQIEKLEKENAEIKEQEPPGKADDINEKLKTKQIEFDALKIDYSDQLQALKNKKLEIEGDLSLILQKKQSLQDAITKHKSFIETSEASVKVIEVQSGKCVIDQRIGCNKDFTAYLEHMKSKIQIASMELQELSKEQSSITKEIDELQKVTKEISGDMDNIQIQERKALRDSRELQGQINVLKQELQTIESFESLKSERIKSKEEELIKLKSVPAEAIAPIDLLEKQKEGLNNQIKELKAKLEEQEKAKITLSNLKNSMIDSKQARYYADCFKYLSETLGAKGVQGEMVKENLGPIQAAVQENLEMMGVSHEFYFSTESDNGKEIFQFGWINEKSHRINFNALSTGQKLMVLIAIMTTIIEKANPPVKVLAIDNIENLDKVNLKRVLNGINQISSKLDNIILCGVIDKEEIEGFTVWHLEGGITNDHII